MVRVTVNTRCFAAFTILYVILYLSISGVSPKLSTLLLGAARQTTLPRLLGKLYNLNFTLLSAGRTSPQLDSLTKSPPLEQTVQTPPSAAPAPPAPVGQRSQTAVAAPRPTSTAAGSQKPPDLLEQRKGENTC